MGMSELKGCHCCILKIIRIVATTNNGKFTVSWWLRSADSTYDSCVYAVGPEGEIGSTNAYDMNGIRPAFCVDGKQEIYKEEGRYILK